MPSYCLCNQLRTPGPHGLCISPAASNPRLGRLSQDTHGRCQKLSFSPRNPSSGTYELRNYFHSFYMGKLESSSPERDVYMEIRCCFLPRKQTTISPIKCLLFLFFLIPWNKKASWHPFHFCYFLKIHSKPNSQLP